MALNFRTLTAANSIIILSAPPIFIGQQIQGYSTDDVADTEDADVAETMMGVDGNLSAGYVPFSTKQVYTLQADSYSNDLFEGLIAAQKAAKDLFFMSGIISLPGISRTYTLTKGVLKTINQIPGIGKTLKARKYGIEWESVDPVTTL